MNNKLKILDFFAKNTFFFILIFNLISLLCFLLNQNSNLFFITLGLVLCGNIGLTVISLISFYPSDIHDMIINQGFIQNEDGSFSKDGNIFEFKYWNIVNKELEITLTEIPYKNNISIKIK